MEDLTEHFSFEELSRTDHADLQEENREEAKEYMASLKALAMLLEGIRSETGPLLIHSAFRCATLNGQTAGSAKTSQHMLGEAADFTAAKSEPTPGNVDGLFEQVLAACISHGLPFGQLIRETAQRSYGTVDWVHISLGVPFRPAEKCGQVLRMNDGKYTMIKTVPIGR